MNISQSQPQYATYYASPYPVYSHHQYQYFTGALENSQMPSPSTSGSQYSSSPSPQDYSSQDYPLAPSQEPHAQYYLSSHQDQGYEPPPPDYYQAQAQVFTHGMVTYGDPVLVHAHINAQEAYQHQRPNHQNHSSHHHPFPIQQIDQMPMPLPSCQEPLVYLEPHPRHSNLESIYAYPTPPPSAYPTPSSDSSPYEYADPKPTPAPVQLAPPQAQPSNAVLVARFGGQLAGRSHANIYAGGSGGGLGMSGGMAPTTANFRAPNTNRRPRPRPRPSNPSISGSSTIILGDRRLSSSVSSTSEFYFSSLLSSTPLLSSKHKTIQIPHPYARLHAKKDEVKRRKIWNHALEKSIFSPYELYVYLPPICQFPSDAFLDYC